MTREQIQAVNDVVLVIRNPPETERGGLLIPDSAKPKPHSGKIISIGEMVVDKKIRVDRTAIFNKNTGFELTFDDGDLTVLRSTEVLGVL